MAEYYAVEQHHRQRYEGNERKGHGNGEHEDIGKHNGKQAYEKILRAMMRYLRNLKKIIRYAAHYRAGLSPVEIREGKQLQMIEQVLPHLIFYPDSEYMSPADTYICADCLKDIHCKHHGKDNDHKPHIPVCNRSVKQIVCQQRENDRQE